MTEIEITGIRKDNGNHENPYEAIEAYQWVNRITREHGLVDRAGGVKWVQEGNAVYVARVQPRAYCFVGVSGRGTRFLQTRPDATDQNNLLKLPEV